MTKKNIGIGFIGAGEISIFHAKALRDIPNAELVGLWNRTEERAKKRAKEEGCKRYISPEELVKDPTIEGVFVLTNLETHLRFAKLAMEAGKHVLVEKPLCFSVPEIEEMKAIAEKSGVVCMPGHNMIHEDSLKRTRKLIENGDLGKIVSCYVMYNIRHSEERASTLPGVVRHILTHNLYTMMYLVGHPKRVNAFKANRHYEKLDQEDITLVNIELENGGLAHLCASFAADDLSPNPWTFTVKVIGTAGTTNYTYQDWVEVKKGISHAHTYTAYQETITNEDRYFIDVCIKGGGKPLSDLEDAIWAQKTTEAIEKSILEGITVEVK
jgi:predicted dehydrogenase